MIPSPFLTAWNFYLLVVWLSLVLALLAIALVDREIDSDGVGKDELPTYT